MAKTKNKIKYLVMVTWFLFLCLSLYIYFFDSEIIKSGFSKISDTSLLLGYLVYLVVSVLRGFTLIPITYFLVIGIILFPPWPLYVLTLIGALVSAACLYYFSEYLNFDEYFEEKHPKQIERIKKFLSKNELPIVIVWSFTPFLPTDLICYVCGTLEVDIKKLLLGVFIGEGIGSLIYIFMGKEILSYVF